MKKVKKNPLKIASLTRMDTKDERYKFSLSIHGYVINGFVYIPYKKSIQMPTCMWGGKKVAIVRSRGIHIIRLRERLDRFIAAAKGEGEEDGD